VDPAVRMDPVPGREYKLLIDNEGGHYAVTYSQDGKDYKLIVTSHSKYVGLFDT